MQAIADTTALYLLEFTDNQRLEQKIAKLFALTDVTFVHQSNRILEHIEGMVTQT